MFFALLFPKACRHQHQAAGQEAHPVGNSKNDHAKHGPEEHNVALHARPREHDDCHKRRQASVDHRRPLVYKCGPNTFCFAQRCALLAEGFRNVGWIFKIKKRVQSRQHKNGEAAEWNWWGAPPRPSRQVRRRRQRPSRIFATKCWQGSILATFSYLRTTVIHTKAYCEAQECYAWKVERDVPKRLWCMVRHRNVWE